jgi:hypothetical protein
MSSNEQVKYINEKYKEICIEKNSFSVNDWFNPNIYTDEGYIPVCKVCEEDFMNFKKIPITENMKCEMKHPNSCLWHEWFSNKIKNISRTVKFIRKR